MIRICFVFLGICLLISGSPLIAGAVSVRVNGIDYGSLCEMSVSTSSIVIDTSSCSTPEHPPTDELIDPSCAGEDSVCVYYSLDVTDNGNYDKQIEPLKRHVYRVRTPSEGGGNLHLSFRVVDFVWGKITNRLGISEVEGRTEPTGNEEGACYTPRGIVNKLSVGTDADYKCILKFDTDYYFTIENLDSILGGYRLEFATVNY